MAPRLQALILATALVLAAPACAQTPGTDISDWLEERWEAREPASLPAGTFYLDRPVTGRYAAGSQLTGVGPGHPNLAGRPLHSLNGSATYIVVRHAGVAIHLTGAKHKIEGVTFVGGGDQESVCLLLSKGDRRGLGTGKGVVSDCEFVSFGTAVQIGVRPEEHNNDECTWRRLRFYDCRVAFRQVNSQAMGHLIARCMFPASVEFPVVIDGGGDMDIEHPTCYGRRLLFFTDRNPKAYRPGPNNAQVRVHNLKVDAAHKGRFRLVDCEPGGGGHSHVIARGGVVSGKAPLASRIGPKMRLTIRDVDYAGGEPVQQGGSE